MEKDEIKNVKTGGAKLSDREVSKWTKILGAEDMIQLFIAGRIELTTEQLELIVKVKNGEAHDE